MNNRRFIIGVIIALLILLVFGGGPLLFFRSAWAAPENTPGRFIQTGLSRFISLSAVAFAPVSRHAIYAKDPNQQLLTLAGHTGNFIGSDNLFVLGLTLPDQAQLTGFTAYGQDFDSQGQVGLRLKRCEHGQPICQVVAQLTSDILYNAGPYTKVSDLRGEYVDNYRFTYFLELEITALDNSGLQSVRLDLVETGAMPHGEEQQWEMAGTITNFLVASGNTRRTVRVCTFDLGPNSTHYPVLVVDGVSRLLASNQCVEDVTGYNIELRRQLNTGPSSGTYQFLR
jgi:hypothetical protein